MIKRFNPYVVAGSIMSLTGAYSITDDFQMIPMIILIIGMVLVLYGYWNYEKIDNAMSIYRKMERRNKEMGEAKNMFDLNKLHLEDEVNEDVSFEKGLAEYVENTKNASVDTLAEEFKGFPMFKFYAGAVRGGAGAETTTRLIGSMILGRSITDEKFRDRLNKASCDLTFSRIDELMRKEIVNEKDKN